MTKLTLVNTVPASGLLVHNGARPSARTELTWEVHMYIMLSSTIIDFKCVKVDKIQYQKKDIRWSQGQCLYRNSISLVYQLVIHTLMLKAYSMLYILATWDQLLLSSSMKQLIAFTLHCYIDDKCGVNTNLYLNDWTSGMTCFVALRYVQSCSSGVVWSNYIPRIRRIGGCYGFTSKPPAARHPPPAGRHPPPAARHPPPAMVLTR